MKFTWTLTVLTALCLTGEVTAQPIIPPEKMEKIDKHNAPRPYTRGNPEFSCAFATDYVGSDIPRRFFIELNLPSKEYPELKLLFDKSKVKYLDQRTLDTAFLPNGKKAPKRRNIRRFYFETLQGVSGKTEISFQHGNSAVTVPFVIWNYEDLRRPKLVNGEIFPRRWPLNRRVEKLKPPVATHKIGGQKPLKMLLDNRFSNKDRYDTGKYSMEEIWQIAPDAGMAPRAMFASPDPIYGDRAFKAGGAFFPYKILAGEPGKVNQWYIISPVDGRRIPDNNLAAGDYSSGKWIDDGFNGIEVNGRIYRYVSQWAWWRGQYIYDLAETLADNFLRTGDTHYLDLALTAFAELP